MTSKPIPAERYSAFMERVNCDTPNGCWEWIAGKNIHGYGQFTLGGKQVNAYEAAYRMFAGEIPEGLVVCHCCHNRPCVNPDHLAVGTQSQNLRMSAQDGVAFVGELNGNAKLTQAQVDEIRERAQAGENQTALGKEFGIGQQQVSRIKNQQRWNRGYNKSPSPRRRFTDDEIAEIRKRAASGLEKQADIAADFNISQSTVSNIHAHNKAWGRVIP